VRAALCEQDNILALPEKLVGRGEPEKTDKRMISSDFYCIKIEKSMLTCKTENDDALAKPPGTQRDKWSLFYLFEYADKILCVLRALARTAFVLTHELSRRGIFYSSHKFFIYPVTVSLDLRHSVDSGLQPA